MAFISRCLAHVSDMNYCCTCRMTIKTVLLFVQAQNSHCRSISQMVCIKTATFLVLSSNENYLFFNYLPDYKNSRMFGLAPESIIDILKNDPVTPNFHSFCLTQQVYRIEFRHSRKPNKFQKISFFELLNYLQNLTQYGLDKKWKILSHNQDVNGLEFVSSIEHKKQRFF